MDANRPIPVDRKFSRHTLSKVPEVTLIFWSIKILLSPRTPQFIITLRYLV